jgi:hypothetical protein
MFLYPVKASLFNWVAYRLQNLLTSWGSVYSHIWSFPWCCFFINAPVCLRDAVLYAIRAELPGAILQSAGFLQACYLPFPYSIFMATPGFALMVLLPLMTYIDLSCRPKWKTTTLSSPY